MEGIEVIGECDGIPIWNLHRVPLGDTREHLLLRGCWCRPFLEISGRGFIFQHVAEDCREFFAEDIEYGNRERERVWRRELVRGMGSH